eukprot:Skav210949  [mRNA]  locus=scaffold713:269054:274721:- [translate_table: standard]
MELRSATSQMMSDMQGETVLLCGRKATKPVTKNQLRRRSCEAATSEAANASQTIAIRLHHRTVLDCLWRQDRNAIREDDGAILFFVSALFPAHVAGSWLRVRFVTQLLSAYLKDLLLLRRQHPVG